MAKGRKKRKKRSIRKLSEYCVFCKEGMVPSYKDTENLAKFQSDRAKIYGQIRSGVCSKHQRVLGREVKRARHLGLLPYRRSV